jgi:hypothetical protein
MMSKESKTIKKERRDNRRHRQKETKTGAGSVTASESTTDPMGKWIRDLEIIFEKAMQEEKLNIALKAKELLARNKGWIAGGVASTPLSIKSIDQWTLQEINSLIAQLDAYGGSGGAPDGDSGSDSGPSNDGDPDGDLDDDPDISP